jgi:fructokinase
MKAVRMGKTVFSFGEILWDLLPDDRILGGAPFNFVYRVHSLGNTGYIVSSLGDDDLGREARRAVVDLALDTAYLQSDPNHPTGTVNIWFDKDGRPDFHIVPGVAYDHVELTEELCEGVRGADCLCFGSLAQRAGKSRDTVRGLIEEAGKALKFFDINMRKECYNSEILVYSLGKADVLKLNEDEARELADMLGVDGSDVVKFCRQVLEKESLQYCVVTLGPKGAFAVSDDGEEVYDPGYEVELADVLGAGDAFSAGFVDRLLAGASLREACEYGNLLGAIVATQKGATQPISAQGVELFRQTHTQRIREEALVE